MEYISSQEVKTICREINMRDWTRLKDPPRVTAEEARKILKLINTGKMPIAVEDFRAGLEVELEHGTRFKDANVTNNHPLITGRIVLAHMKESLDYYKLLEVAELEGDLLKAIAAGNPDAAKKYYKRLAAARVQLHAAELKRIK